MCEGISQNELFYKIREAKPLLLPVPLSKARLRMRGYNQSALLTIYVAQYFGLDISEKILFRVKNTKPQFNLDKIHRKSNISDAFAIPKNKKSLINNKTIVLIDDVATTCSTLRECARVLRKAGSGPVYGVTFAKEM